MFCIANHIEGIIINLNNLNIKLTGNRWLLYVPDFFFVADTNSDILQIHWLFL